MAAGAAGAEPRDRGTRARRGARQHRSRLRRELGVRPRDLARTRMVQAPPQAAADLQRADALERRGAVGIAVARAPADRAARRTASSRRARRAPSGSPGWASTGNASRWRFRAPTSSRSSQSSAPSAAPARCACSSSGGSYRTRTCPCCWTPSPRPACRGEAELVLHGGGPLEAELRERIARLGVAARVAGPVPPAELPAAYAQADVLALVSTYEPFGVTMREGAAAGLPLLCSRRAGAAGDVAVDGENALLVDPDSRAEVVAALRRLVRDPELRARLAAGSRAVTERHPLERRCRGLGAGRAAARELTDEPRQHVPLDRLLHRLRAERAQALERGGAVGADALLGQLEGGPDRAPERGDRRARTRSVRARSARAPAAAPRRARRRARSRAAHRRRALRAEPGRSPPSGRPPRRRARNGCGRGTRPP